MSRLSPRLIVAAAYDKERTFLSTASECQRGKKQNFEYIPHAHVPCAHIHLAKQTDDTSSRTRNSPLLYYSFSISCHGPLHTLSTYDSVGSCHEQEALSEILRAREHQGHVIIHFSSPLRRNTLRATFSLGASKFSKTRRRGKGTFRAREVRSSPGEKRKGIAERSNERERKKETHV